MSGKPRVRLFVADGPVEEVLEGPRQASGVLQRRKEQRIGAMDRAAKVRHYGVERVHVVIGAEMRQRTEALVEDGIDVVRCDSERSAQRRHVC